MGAYDDIIHLPHPTSPKHPRMSRADRAAQFAPFAALAGHGAAIQETARRTDRKMELTEDEQAVLDEKLRRLAVTGGEAAFTYFVPDGKKSGGAYVTEVRTLKKMDPLGRRLIFADGTSIPVEDIAEVEIGALREPRSDF